MMTMRMTTIEKQGSMARGQGLGVRDQGPGGRAGVPARHTRCTGWKACATKRKQQMSGGHGPPFYQMRIAPPLVPKLYLGTPLRPKLCLGNSSAGWVGRPIHQLAKQSFTPNWVPFVDSFRTDLAMPSSELLATINDLPPATTIIKPEDMTVSVTFS